MNEQSTTMEKFSKVITLAGSAILMNLLFLIACLPIVTIGQAWAGLASALRYQIRGDKWIAGFKAGFLHRFWRGTLAWCIMLPINAFMISDVNDALVQGATVPLVFAGLMSMLTVGLTVSLLMMNVYIPTKVGTWITNSVNMVFKAPLQLAVSAVLFTFPVLCLLLWFDVFYFAIMIFVAAYYTVAALVVTMLLKQPLIYYLLEARAQNLLIEEE